MSFLELVEAAEALKNGGARGANEAPIFGNTVVQSTNIKSAKKFKQLIRYYVGNMNDPSDREFISNIMTRGLDKLESRADKDGDVIVIREDSNWTKEGDYLVAIKYVELVEITG